MTDNQMLINEMDGWANIIIPAVLIVWLLVLRAVTIKQLKKRKNEHKTITHESRRMHRIITGN